jgi:cell division protein FtsN
MARNERNGKRAALTQKPRRGGGGLFLGLLMGLVIGLVFAAGLAWYIYTRPTGLKPAEHVPEPHPLERAESAAPKRARPERPQPGARQPAKPPVIPRPEPVQVAPSESHFSFYDILPGEKPSRPNEPKLPREVWWLQVAALANAKDADRLKANLALLGLSVQVQAVKGNNSVLHRVRVGPFKTEDDALGALDTLSENNYEPRLFKEAVDKR